MHPSSISRRAFLRGAGLCAAGLALGCPAVPAHAARAASAPYDESRLLMDTIVHIRVARASRSQAEQGAGLAFAEMERLIGLFDRHHGGTALAVLNGQGRLDGAPEELLAVLDAARAYGRLTGRAFDATVQPVLDLFARRGNPQGGLRVDRAELEAALALVGMDHVRVDGGRVRLARAGMGLTLDGIAKGYIADRAAMVLESRGLRHYLINAGGDIRAGGEKRPGEAWTVAVEDPAKAGGYPALISLRGGAVATSGGYERYFDKSRAHTHLLVPSTGDSPDDRLSVTVRAATAMRADALATALSVMPRMEALRLADSLPDCACLLVGADGAVVTSKNWPQLERSLITI